ncbi:FkbM family methyltransferase [Winogradskyella sp. SYSU M77433]|uniref:FkbM family methyltransferase n=1 Tax=Winogradskyella sp. SYSU M77433 TaxID=3042722 RepID=UPI0024802E98|nr:FkbM family methyltransferase [Winogradskyella sp. SYSU M77433]MDH7913363.1 FkbM family methyltransferase [Winogradskyella sp. SYSU M77433]
MFFKKFLHKKKLRRLYKSILKKDSLCFDIGANIGYKSSIFLSLKHTVVAFEPQENCQNALNKLNQEYPDFSIVNMAIGSENATLDLSLGNHIEIATLSNKFKSYFTTDSIYWNKKQPVKVVTLNSQIERYGIPDFCKIDVEGYEYEVLKSLNYKIPLIEFEFTGGFVEETILCLSKLDELGTYKFNYTLNENPIFIRKIWLSAKELKLEINEMNIKNLHGNILAKLIK